MRLKLLITCILLMLPVVSAQAASNDCVATASAPAYQEGNSAPCSVTLDGKIRTDGGSASVGSVTLASAVTTNTTSTAVAGLRGTKTFYGAVDGTGAVTQTQAIYGGLTSGVTSTTGELICTFTLSGTTHAHSVCVSMAPYLFYIVVTTNTTGTSATGAVTAMY